MSRHEGCPITGAEQAELLEILRRTFQKPDADGVLHRQFHRKTHGCLKATLTLDPPDDPRIRHGLFARPGVYPALVRFSSSFFDDDAAPDLRGLAIKLGRVDGEVCEGAPPGQQDFVMMSEAFGPAKDAAEAMHLFRALGRIKKVSMAAVALPRYLFPSLWPWRIRWRYWLFLNTSALRHLLGKDLAQLTYNSVTPYKLGSDAMKILVCPEDAARERRPVRGEDFRSRLQATLDKGPIRFEFRLQPRVLEEDTLEDARRAWKSPVHRVGWLEIPPQDVAATVPLGDRLTFAPWNCLRAHEPLGTINAMRRSAYAASAMNRGAEAVPPSWD